MFLVLTAWCSLAISPSFALKKKGGSSDFSMDGSATVVHPGNGSATAAQASAIGAAGAGSVNLAIPADFKLSQLTSLSTDYKFVVGSCWNGSPRFTANVTNGTSTGSVFFYLAPTAHLCGMRVGFLREDGQLG